jgi:hypothetical protein
MFVQRNAVFVEDACISVQLVSSVVRGLRLREWFVDLV